MLTSLLPSVLLASSGLILTTPRVIRASIVMVEPQTPAKATPSSPAAVYKPVSVESAATAIREELKAEREGEGVGDSLASRRFVRPGSMLSGESVSAAEIVAVLARWRSFTEWDSIGALAEMDCLFDAEGQVQDGPALQAAWERWEEAHDGSLWSKSIKLDRTAHLPPYKSWSVRDTYWTSSEEEEPTAAGPQPWAARSPERRGWCIRRGQAQRWWFRTNVPLLPVRDDMNAFTQSVGSGELPDVSPLACDIVFDA